MEYVGPPEPGDESSEGHEETSDKKSKKSRKRLSFVASWLARREREEQPEVEDTRKEGILKRFFGKFVGLESVKESSESSDHEPADETFQYTRPEIPPEWRPHDDESVVTPTAGVEERSEVSARVDSPDNLIKPEQGSMPQSEEEREQTEASEKSEPVEPIQDQPEEGFAEFPPIPQEHVTRPSYSEQQYMQQAQLAHAENTTPHQETDRQAQKIVYDRRGEPLAAATLVGLGLEHGARKRADKELQKRSNTLENRIQAQESNVQAITTARVNPESVSPAAGTKFERVVMQEKTPEKPQQKPEVPLVTRPESYRQQPEVAVTTPVAPEKAQPARIIEKERPEVAERYEHIMREKEELLKRVVAAAETNEPIEREYELRQEIRDEPGGGDTTVQGAGAASVGSILSRSSVGQQTMTTSPPYDSRAAQHLTSAQQQDLYKKAMQRGFIGALVVIVFSLIAYIASLV
jgi:hypothetical protein